MKEYIKRNFMDYEREADQFPSKDMSRYLAELNLSRGRMAAGGLMLLQLANLLDSGFWETPGLWVACCMIVVVSLLFLINYYIYKRSGVKDSRWSWGALGGYWILVCLGMIPYFMYDVTQDNLPANCIVLCSALMIIPVFPVRQTVYLFMGYGAVNLAISIGMGAPAVYHLQIVIICTLGCLFSCSTHQFYMGLLGAMKERSRKDYMTNLLNRRGSREGLDAILDFCLRSKKTIAFFMVDVDGFKKFNDTFGHQQGDAALVAAADCLKFCFERKTDLLCRYGGEEFLVAAVVNSGDEAMLLAEEARNMVESCGIESACPEVSPFLTVSMGVAVFAPDEKRKYNITVDQMIREADQALYRAKGGGRNRVCLFLVEEQQEAEPKNGNAVCADEGRPRDCA